MILYWYTQPPSAEATPTIRKNSSFYQYDTVTKKFVRIRLELNRSTTEANPNPQVLFKDKRYVGFLEPDPTGKRLDVDRKLISIKDDALFYTKQTMLMEPKPGYIVFDATPPITAVHRGNAITIDPKWPENVKVEHLMLLANDAFERETGGDLGLSTAGDEALSKTIIEKAHRIAGIEPSDLDDPSRVNEKILVKLKAQATRIREAASLVESENANGDLAAAQEKLNGLSKELQEAISKQQEEGGTPDQSIEDAVKHVQDAVNYAGLSTDPAIQQQAIESIQAAKSTITKLTQGLENAISNETMAQTEAVKVQLDFAESRLQSSVDTATEIDNIGEAETFDDFKRAIDPEVEAEAETIV